VTALAEFAMLSHGWRRFLLMLFAGLVAGASVAPLFILPALFVAMPVWIWALDGAERRSGWGRVFGPAFAIGFAFGLGYFLVAIHWVGAAFLVDGGPLVYLSPFAVLALAAILALFWGLASALAHLLWSNGPWRLVVFAACLAAAEYLRGHVASGFPFDLLGYALTANDEMAQAASLIGVYGLTFVAALVTPVLALVWPADQRAWPARLMPLFAALIVIALQLGYGNVRLGGTLLVDRDDMKLRLVQPAIPQDLKWELSNREATLNRLFELSESRLYPDDPGLAGVTHVVWPESALPFFLSDYPEALARIGRLLPDNVLLLTGSPREDYLPDGGPDISRPGYNSILAIDTDGEVVASYDKAHLVPFGEYFPFQSWLGGLGLRQLVNGSDGWSAGPSPRRLFSAPGTPPIVPLICYEAVFPDELSPAVAGGELILNVTNDAWFDGTIGPAQHFHHARLRAVEQGLPLVRVANTGVTAMVDPLGRVTVRLAEREMAVADVVPSRPVARPLYALVGEWPLLAVLGLVLGGALMATRRRQRLGS
jgi:apolipoprotein N-acyltransferase